jgi:type II secretory pathway pseudopilin PulG
MTRAMRNSRGLTLAELLIVCAILGFIMAALFTLQRQGQLAYLTGSARVEVQQNARLALDSMITDLRSALPVAGSTTQVIGTGNIDPSCASGPPPSNGGTYVQFTAQDGHTVRYQLTGTDLERVDNGVTTVLVGGVQQFRIWCYDNTNVPNLSATAANIREIRVHIRTQTERGAQAGSAGDQHATVEARVRFRNI